MPFAEKVECLSHVAGKRRSSTGSYVQHRFNTVPCSYRHRPFVDNPYSHRVTPHGIYEIYGIASVVGGFVIDVLVPFEAGDDFILIYVPVKGQSERQVTQVCLQPHRQ